MGKTTKFSAALFLAVVIAIFVAATPIAVLAHMGEDEEGELAVGKELVEKGASCNDLDDEQLEAIGEYMMGIMHPGEAHELMHQRMGIEEGTPYHEKFHINLAQSMYCGEAPMAGMMGMMQMMGSMPWWNDASSKYGLQSTMPTMPMQRSMMGNWGYGSGYSGYWNLLNVLYVMLLLGLIALVYFWVVKLWRSGKKKRG